MLGVEEYSQLGHEGVPGSKLGMAQGTFFGSLYLFFRGTPATTRPSINARRLENYGCQPSTCGPAYPSGTSLSNSREHWRWQARPSLFLPLNTRWSMKENPPTGRKGCRPFATRSVAVRSHGQIGAICTLTRGKGGVHWWNPSADLRGGQPQSRPLPLPPKRHTPGGPLGSRRKNRLLSQHELAPPPPRDEECSTEVVATITEQGDGDYTLGSPPSSCSSPSDAPAPASKGLVVSSPVASPSDEGGINSTSRPLRSGPLLFVHKAQVGLKIPVILKFACKGRHDLAEVFEGVEAALLVALLLGLDRISCGLLQLTLQRLLLGLAGL
ncbi:hypothetical protein Cgig2_029002 [Carnegiea gigantea]|uniref:Uncharacterized protein n=1 Tax=Carnegiea gigantea TaxID=171969 RepID=A0A9Q1GK53_9CARY|nr:hypothetical protein Cgig2_029002 [Carnegiea gigantea]